MKLRWIALAAASVVVACGGDGDKAETPVAPPAQPEEFSMAVRPHLGTVRPGATLIMQPLADGRPPLTATIPAQGDPVFKIPRDRCGPGLIALQGSSVTLYFDEGTGRYEVLPETEKIRALVPDICGSDAGKPVSLSLLDEVALHVSSERSAEFEEKLRTLRDAVDHVAGVDPARMVAAQAAMRAAMEEAIRAALLLRSDLAAQLAQLLGLPDNYADLLPTPIDDASSVIPPSGEGQVAATLRAMQQIAASVREATMDRERSLLEAQAAQLARVAKPLRDPFTAQKKPTAVIDNVLGASAQFALRFGHLTDIDTDDTAKALGVAATRAAADLPAILDSVAAAMKDSPAIVANVEKARGQARGQAPVANADMSLALRTALTPALLRVEPTARLRTALTTGKAEFACTAGTLARGKVLVTFVDLDTSGGLTSGDRFDLVYDNCLVAEPVSGLTLAKSGTMRVTYDPRDPGGAQPDIRGQVVFAMRFHADSGALSAKQATLFQASGQWADRAAFGAPGAVAASLYAGATPAVLLDDATLTIRQDGVDYTTEIDVARFDMSAGLANASSSGQAGGVLQMEGLVGPLRYNTGAGMVFTRSDGVLRLSQGSFNYKRQSGGTGTGSIAAGDGGLFVIGLTDGSGQTTQRSLRWDTIVTAYLAK